MLIACELKILSFLYHYSRLKKLVMRFATSLNLCGHYYIGVNPLTH